jgi:hypothetical protein
MPCILKRLDLGFRLFAGRALEKDVVRRLAVERGIEIDEIYTLIVEHAPKDREVIAVVKTVHGTVSVSKAFRHT